MLTKFRRKKFRRKTFRHFSTKLRQNVVFDEMSFRRNRFRRNVMDPITKNLSSEMEKSDFLALRSGGTLKHIAEWGKSKRRVVIRMCQHIEVWFFNPLCSNGLYLIQTDRIKMELFIVYLYNMRSPVTSSKF